MGKEGQCRVRRQLDAESREEEDERDGRRFCMRMGDGGDVKGISPKKIPHAPSHPIHFSCSFLPCHNFRFPGRRTRVDISCQDGIREAEKKFCPLFFSRPCQKSSVSADRKLGISLNFPYFLPDWIFLGNKLKTFELAIAYTFLHFLGWLRRPGISVSNLQFVAVEKKGGGRKFLRSPLTAISLKNERTWLVASFHLWGRRKKRKTGEGKIRHGS